MSGQWTCDLTYGLILFRVFRIKYVQKLMQAIGVDSVLGYLTIRNGGPA